MTDDTPDPASEDTLDDESDALPEELQKALAKLPAEEREKVQRFVSRITMTRQFSGPLPPPDFLRGYEDVLAGAADRVITMSEDEQKHYHSTVVLTIKSEQGLQRWGLLAAWSIGAIALIGTFTVTVINQETPNVAVVISAIAVLVGVFIFWVRPQRDKSELPDGEIEPSGEI